VVHFNLKSPTRNSKQGDESQKKHVERRAGFEYNYSSGARMKKTLAALAVVVVVCFAVISRSAAAADSSKSQAQVTRGEYLVKAIGQCADCHTPFTLTGAFVMDKWLQGKKLEFGPLIPIPIWAPVSPNIAGLDGWDQEKAVQFFMTGLAPNGQPPRPPMPAYKMNRADAEAVVAYLKSLKSSGQ
jgi:mono/diheme cytochrome c family protein